MRITLLALLFFPATAGGQALDSARAHELMQELLVPIHTQPDDPDGGAYGIWAVGPNYKVSFHDGFAFYPDLGPDAPRHLPLQWRTESVTLGDVDLLTEAPLESYAGQRFERRSGDLIEAYEVRRDGVEQTFTLLAPPKESGALTIAGRITTPLSAPIRAPRHGELVFAEDGRPVVRYGGAFAIDAVGRSWPLETSYDGGCIRLCVPAEIVAAASYPLLVDPLTSATALNTGSNYLARPAIAASTETQIANPGVVVAWYRNPTANDFDVYALVTDVDFQSSTWLYQDVTTSWSTPVVDVAYTGFTTPAWVLALQRDLTASKVVRAYVHAEGNTTMNGGTTLFVHQPAGVEQINPAIGGSVSSTSALLVFDRLETTTQLNFSWGALVNVVSPSLGTSFRFDAGLLVETHRPSVTPVRGNLSGWIVALSVGADVRVAQVTTTPSSSVVATEYLTTPAGNGITPHTQVAGSNGRYLLVSRGGLASLPVVYIKAHRFDWPSNASSPTLLRDTVLGRSAVGDAHLEGSAFDSSTGSHWAISYEADNVHTLVRCGYTGGITESHTLPGPIDVAFAAPLLENTYPIAYAQISISGISVRARQLGYPTNAIAVPYGTSCAPGTYSSARQPFAGNEFYRMTLASLPAGAPVIFALSWFPDHLDLGSIGLFGCYLNVLLPATTLASIAGGNGLADVTLALPDDPPFRGDFYTQWIFIDSGAAQPVRATEGTRHQIR